LLLPEFLAVFHSYRPDQTGQVLGWISLIELIAAPIAGLMLYKIDSRLLCAIGFAISGFTCFLSSRIDPGWTGETFVASQIMNAIGVAFALTGLVTTILRNALAAGALQKPANTLSLSCWFQTCRLFGAEIGKTVLVRFLTIDATFRYTVLSQHIDGGWLTAERLKIVALNLLPGSSGVSDALVKALETIGTSLKQQIALLSLIDGFRLIAFSAAICMFLLAFLKYAPPLVPTTKKAAA